MHAIAVAEKAVENTAGRSTGDTLEISELRVHGLHVPLVFFALLVRDALLDLGAGDRQVGGGAAVGRDRTLLAFKKAFWASGALYPLALRRRWRFGGVGHGEGLRRGVEPRRELRRRDERGATCA